MSVGRALRAFLAGALGAVVAGRALRSAPPGGADRWTRVNHAGDPVTLLEGPSYAVGAAAGALAGGCAGAATVAALGSAAFGALDDLLGDSASKGLRGHLSALRDGRLTTGSVKVLGLGVTGLVAAVIVDRRSARAHQPSCTLVGGAVIAGSANLANLLDLRPGRALKATLIAAAPLATGCAGSATAAAAAGAAAGVLPGDLAGRSMLGDTGANSAGALIGTAIVERAGTRGRLATLAVLTFLTLASEKVSFTSVIESTPGLRELDALGRRPQR